jgi:5-methylcytosine-specific restriction endonuclease McrA
MACLKTKQEIQLLIAKHCPQPDVPDAVRRLPTARLATAIATQLDGLTLPLNKPESGHASPSPENGSTSSSVQVVQSQGNLSAEDELPLAVAPVTPHVFNREPALPIREGRYKIQFTAGQRVHDLLQEAQDLFRNQLPNGDIEVLVERALGLLVAERKKELFAQTDKPRRSSGVTALKSKPHSRHIPNATKRRVYLRDKGQCRFASPTGERCCARSRLEFHHVHAFGLGGPTTEQNVVLFCHAHNALMAERDYSREHIQRCIRASQVVRPQSSTTRVNPQATTKSTHAKTLNQAQLSGPQYKSTRSGIFGPNERRGGCNQPCARNPSESA